MIIFLPIAVLLVWQRSLPLLREALEPDWSFAALQDRFPGARLIRTRVALLVFVPAVACIAILLFVFGAVAPGLAATGFIGITTVQGIVLLRGGRGGATRIGAES